jgi:hypothetical protein
MLSRQTETQSGRSRLPDCAVAEKTTRSSSSLRWPKCGSFIIVKPKLYIETSVIGYLTSAPVREPLVAAHQQLTREWWQAHRFEYELFTSRIAVEEAIRGNQAEAQLRTQALADVTRVAVTPAVEALVPALLKATGLPLRVYADMSHVAVATIHGMQYLLTWNCRHIANAKILPKVARACREYGYEPPVICTPEQLMGE